MDKLLKDHLHRHNIYSHEAMRGAEATLEYVTKKLLSLSVPQAIEQIEQWRNML